MEPQLLRRAFLKVTFLFALSVLSSGCQTNTSENGRTPLTPYPLVDGKEWAQDVRFFIAGQVVHLPLATVSSLYKDSTVNSTCEKNEGETLVTPNVPSICSLPLKKAAELIQSYPEHPFSVTSLSIKLVEFGIVVDDAKLVPTSVCSHLIREWTRQLCLPDYTGDNINLIRAAESVGRFNLVHKNYLYVLGGDTVFNALGANHISSYVHGSMAQVPLDNPNPYALCNLEWCGVVMQLEGDLLAAWTTHIDNNQPGILEKQARTIRAFVQFGMDETEDFPALNNALKQ